jgi:DNA-directed RNA polymerase omega subunit
MTWQHDTMMNPPIEELLDRAGSKFRLVTLGAMRARQINSYFGQLGDTSGKLVPAAGHLGGPQAAVDRLRGDRRRQDRGVDIDPEALAAEAAEIEAAEAAAADAEQPRLTRQLRAGLKPITGPMLAGRDLASSSGSPAASPPTRRSRSAVVSSTPAPTSADHDSGALRFVGETTFSALASEPVRHRCGTRPTRSRTPGSARAPT